MQALILTIVTALGAGMSPIAPGTVGSLVGLGLSSFFKFENFELFVISAIIFIVGYATSDLHVKKLKNKDPKEVVIDEVAGMMLTLALCFEYIDFIHEYYNNLFILNNWYVVTFIGFVLFRLFDIIKPWPISYIENKTKGGLGIMLDDVAAALMSGIVFAIIVPFILLLCRII